jgi:hypothetical protein
MDLFLVAAAKNTYIYDRQRTAARLLFIQDHDIFLTKNLDQLLLLFAVVSESLSHSLSSTRRVVVAMLPRNAHSKSATHSFHYRKQPYLDFFSDAP